MTRPRKRLLAIMSYNSRVRMLKLVKLQEMSAGMDEPTIFQKHQKNVPKGSDEEANSKYQNKNNKN
jgi:hypothetical protein